MPSEPLFPLRLLRAVGVLMFCGAPLGCAGVGAIEEVGANQFRVRADSLPALDPDVDIEAVGEDAAARHCAGRGRQLGSSWSRTDGLSVTVNGSETARSQLVLDFKRR